MTQALMFRDASITSLTGSSQQVLPKNGNRQFLAIENTGTANVAVNLAGGTAAIAGTGCITIVPNGSLLLDRVVPQNPITAIGTSGQPLTVIEA